ncbi:DNA mismatch repair protein MutL [Methylophaga frappieri]|uniref:DNA mismatch repair protein MutL n=1 Tax=Methylophaga frappieri (strain ATCC BAA-2434 / DSM 25690 / JAM7) TaxID=754477 RepID=I1YIS4_METFJ|nr:DNA mismatch repair endonuclease MutL [Methylophaga frappieri]AFJ02817.1 DNA mismatch repair protein MutL [Methylophaga frappieri]
MVNKPLNIPRIHALPLQLANQIAAGEVIERPASVVKELVENSLDAGATQLNIRIEGSGSQLIHVRDNGAGIHPEDLPLALTRHATSKLSSSDQLSQIGSLGFRGEALPSISSVAKLTLISRQADSDCAWQLIPSENTLKPTAHPLGTTVEVRDLFFNLPARRRFLRSARTEQQHILTTLQRLALSRLDIALDCQLNGQQKMVLPAADSDSKQLQRLRKICGSRFVKDAFVIEQQRDLMQLNGWICPAIAHRAHNDIQYFFINGRVIRDRLISHAVRQAFAEQIPAGRHPAYVLYLTLPLDRVDVNVHPTKHEVRFREARLIHGLITSAIRDALRQTMPKSTSTTVPQHTSHYDNQPVSVRESAADYHQLAIPAQPASHSLQIIAEKFVVIHYQQQHWLIDLIKLETELTYQKWCQAIAQNQLSHRPVMVPVSFHIDAAQAELFLAYQDRLEKLGVHIEIENKQLRILAFPTLFGAIDLQNLFDQLVNILANTPDQDMLSNALFLCRHVPRQFTATDAQSLLESCQNLSWQTVAWAKQLDKALLTSLFSE